ncbi:Allantoicase [Dissophora globulifera]|nr:Allantoicase [Dissophora globulifera]
MGQVQSRQQDELHFKLDLNDKDALVNKYTELASSAKGGKVLETSDELFGEGLHLIKEDPAIEDKNRETAHGFWKDGWETRRHNKKTHHTAIIQLASPATVAGFDIDTSFFEGNHPAYASVEACLVVKDVQDSYEWKEILPKVPLNGNSHHFYGIKGSDDVFTHVKLNMYPDGGIARLRVFGKVSPIFPDEKTTFDLASFNSGARVIKTSDDSFGKPSNLILPTAGANVRDGWQTRRARAEGHHDWVEIKLGATGILESLQVDTTHFSGNSPDFVSLDGCQSEYNDVQYDPDVKWVSLLQKSEVHAERKNNYNLMKSGKAFTHVRLNIFPDGGILRLRVYGVRVPDVVAPVELETVEEQLTQSVDDLKVNESRATVVPSKATLLAAAANSAKTPKAKATKAVKAAKAAAASTTTTTVVQDEVEEEIVGDGQTNVVLTSEVSSVTTLVDEEEPVKKASAKRGRPKGAAATAAASPKAKKSKSLAASVLDEDDETSGTTTTSTATAPRVKKVRD